MRRFLIVDDEKELSFDDELRSDNIVDDVEPDVVHINPNDFIQGDAEGDVIVKQLLNHMRKVSADFWDVVSIDLNLGDFGYKDRHRNLEVCLRVAEAVREQNRAATMFLYSGTLADYIRDILGAGASDTQLRRIFRADVANFVQRNRIAPQATSAIDDPSWILRVDRSLMENSNLKVSPEEAEFSGRSFAELAGAVRRQDKDGQRIVKLVAEYGIAAFIELNE